MQSIRNAVACLIALLSLHRLTGIWHRLRPQHAPQIKQPQSNSSAPSALVSLTEDDDTSAGDSGPEDQFANWDTDRADKLHQAEAYEQQGLRLLAKAALLRVAIKCDSRGETFIAEELREHAHVLDGEYVEALSAEESWQPTTIRFATTDSNSTKRGA
jgi:hypothetical protein